MRLRAVGHVAVVQTLRRTDPLEAVRDAVRTFRGARLLVFPEGALTVASLAERNDVAATLLPLLDGVHAAAIGIAVQVDGSFLAPPPGRWGPAHAPDDPFVSSYLYVRVGRRRWTLDAERRRRLHPGQRLSPLARAVSRSVCIGGLTVAFAFADEALPWPTADLGVVLPAVAQDGRLNPLGPGVVAGQAEPTVGPWGSATRVVLHATTR